VKLTKTRVALISLTLFASTATYIIGRNGIDVGRAIVDSRCSAGAFIAHSKTPSTVQADAHSDAAVTMPTIIGKSTSAQYAPVVVKPANLIANGSLETRNGANPKGWDSNVVGHNTSAFSIVAGDNSPSGLRIDVSNYTDGTADWFGQTLTVTPGAYYQFQDNYRSNVTTRAVLMLTDDTGKSQYINLDSVPASEQWAGYTQRFFVPMNVSHIMISHPLDRAGWLETDNYNLQLATAPAFDEGMVTLTFDDGWRSIHDNALPLMDKYGIVSTQYLVSGFLGSMKEYMTARQVYDFTRTGNEIGSHTVDHPDLTKLSDKELDRQLKVSQAGLAKCYQNVTSFAAPFGSNNEHTLAVEKTLYQTVRSTEVGFNSPDTLQPLQLKVQMRAWLATAKTNHVWLILVYHQVANSGGEYSRTLVDFETDMLLIKASGLENLTMHNAYAKTQNIHTVQ
jgi:peptidoglycan/xylan/chitin deacetylase (PgdA/CDA1 family)